MNRLSGKILILTTVLTAGLSAAASAAVTQKTPPSVTSISASGGDVTVTWSDPGWDGVDKYEIQLDRADDSEPSGHEKYKSVSAAAGENSVDMTISKKGYYQAKVRAQDVNNAYTAWSGYSEKITVTSDDLGGSGSPSVHNSPSGSGGPGVVLGGGTGSGNTGTQQNGGPSAVLTGSGSAASNAAAGRPGNVYSTSSSMLTSKKVLVNTYTSTGWQQDQYGRWYLYQDGTYPVSSWRPIDGHYYHFSPSGYMEVNTWVLESNGNWYFCTADGTMALGFNNVNGAWYYMDPANGITAMGGLHLINGRYYYMNANGARVQNQWVNEFYYGNDGARVN